MKDDGKKQLIKTSDKGVLITDAMVILQFEEKPGAENREYGN